jgi:hypothetical protein
MFPYLIIKNSVIRQGGASGLDSDRDDWKGVVWRSLSGAVEI